MNDYTLNRTAETCLPVVYRRKAVAWVQTKHADVSMIPPFFLKKQRSQVYCVDHISTEATWRRHEP